VGRTMSNCWRPSRNTASRSLVLFYGVLTKPMDWKNVVASVLRRRIIRCMTGKDLRLDTVASVNWGIDGKLVEKSNSEAESREREMARFISPRNSGVDLKGMTRVL
jgi:hypothetical protein